MANLREILANATDGKTVLDKNGAEVSVDRLTGDGCVIGFYFSGAWCGPCRYFTPMLIDWYEKLKPDNHDIIYVNSDENQESYQRYYNTMPWLTAGYDSELRTALRKKYNPIGRVPRLVLVNGQTGETITEDGRQKIMDELEDFALPWKKK
ncbi:tryparedoxin-like [Babylonia areolata]|uniref:tryparedoxin-like n=1 Tax=Babylonia areolata TaxID=304850 RepID=UPI003FD36569